MDSSGFSGPQHAQCAAMRIALVAHHENPTHVRLAAAAPPGVESRSSRPSRLSGCSAPTTRLLRVSTSCHPGRHRAGRWEIGRLEDERHPGPEHARALLATHDKLQTSRVCSRPRACRIRARSIFVTARATSGRSSLRSCSSRASEVWGSDVAALHDAPAAHRTLEVFSSRPWFRTQGVLVQELVPPLGHDLRVVVAGGRSSERSGGRPPRANGGRTSRSAPSASSRSSPRGARARAGRSGRGRSGSRRRRPAADRLTDGWAVIELNGAVEFNDEYSLGRDVFAAAMESLVAAIRSRPQTALAALA